MSVTEFAGVTGDKDRGVTSRSGLYEFWTEKNAHIYLHDTDFTCLTYQPGRPPVLWLEFLYDPQWTPPELSETPVVVFRFEDVLRPVVRTPNSRAGSTRTSRFNDQCDGANQ
ncbi:hypothetical protein LDL08_09600 [Nonomuraea glycinis]|uniref:Uncharacterized protein n=1 Tax=Nonomuraea glycinis TaxID=2047744 RepID=A0A918A520_9ACTN|nr:hypothetical protein [Nonomuraea glycinis]MCA2176436.1 hypothetical protein [Nonomuraea glycinis]GGP07171.1 hypothetical protein GCM10012278_33880 [Nonomuraea glycinis]